TASGLIRSDTPARLPAAVLPPPPEKWSRCRAERAICSIFRIKSGREEVGGGSGVARGGADEFADGRLFDDVARPADRAAGGGHRRGHRAGQAGGAPPHTRGEHH